MIITLPGNKKHWPCFQEIWFLTSEVWFPGFLTYSERLYSPGDFHSLKVSIGIRWFPSFFLLQKFCNFNTFPLWMTFLPVLYFLCLYEKELQNWHLFQHSFFLLTLKTFPCNHGLLIHSMFVSPTSQIWEWCFTHHVDWYPVKQRWPVDGFSSQICI